MMCQRILTLILLTTICACANMPSLIRSPISTNAAVIQLLDDAFWHVDQAQYELAASKLERALRLEPNNAALWFELAEVHLLQGDAANARSLAVRAKSLSNDAALSRDIDRFVLKLDEGFTK